MYPIYPNYPSRTPPAPSLINPGFVYDVHMTTGGGEKMNKELRNLIGLLVEQGFDVKPTKRGHFTVRRAGEYVTTLAGTPSDYRGSKNSRAALKRHGFTPQRE